MLRFCIRLKVYFDRARMYVSYLQTFAVLVTALKVFDMVPPWWLFCVMCVVFGVLCIFVGWLDSRFRIFEEEQKRISEQNPMLVEILDRLKNR